jgi:hypothetical protein
MKKYLLYSMLVSTVFIALLYWFCLPSVNLFTFYADNLRRSLFTGFLTLGAFLFSLTTFIVIKMKEGVYDTPCYNEILEKRKSINPNLSHYSPLRRLSHLLFASVLSALLTSVSQFSIGLINHWITIYLCLWLAFFSMTLMFISLYHVKDNLDRWFHFLESRQKNTYKH